MAEVAFGREDDQPVAFPDQSESVVAKLVDHAVLTRRRVQRASALARQLGRGTTHQARRVWRRVENRDWTEAGAGIGSWRRRNEAPGLAARHLRIAIHHASSRSESKRSLQSRIGLTTLGVP
jgi:hypothetical protein